MSSFICSWGTCFFTLLNQQSKDIGMCVLTRLCNHLIQMCDFTKNKSVRSISTRPVSAAVMAPVLISVTPHQVHQFAIIWPTISWDYTVHQSKYWISPGSSVEPNRANLKSNFYPLNATLCQVGFTGSGVCMHLYPLFPTLFNCLFPNGSHRDQASVCYHMTSFLQL